MMMKGIAIIGGECPSKEVLKKIIQVEDLLIAADSGLIPLEEAGFVPHFIVGDMDSLDTLERLKKYPREIIIQYPKDKDYTDTELALELLWEKGCDEVWIIGGGGGRIDNLFALYSIFERERAPDRWLIPGYELRLIKGKTTLELPQERQVSLFPLGNGPWKIHSRGLKWPLDNLPWKRGFCSISNLVSDDVQELNPLQGSFLLIIPVHV
jgi:thiamine pyrophosphokinase